MKSIYNCCLPADLVDQLRKCADADKCPQSHLVEMGLRAVLSMDPAERTEALGDMMASTPTQRRRGKASLKEEAVLNALKRLEGRCAPCYRFEVRDISRESGLYPSEVLKPLRSLIAKGAVQTALIPGREGALDEMGLPLKIEIFNLPGAGR